jgi:hypothetical protein
MVACSHLPPQGAPSPVMSAAIDGVDYFAARLSNEALAKFGISNRQQLAHASIRQPFREHVVPAERLLAYQPGEELTDLIEATDRWLFPVLVQDQVKALLIVDELQGVPSAVALGSAALAESLMQVRARWPVNEGFQLQYVRAEMADMVVVSVAGVDRITPLTTTAVALQLPPTPDGRYGLYPPDEVLPALRFLIPATLE